MCTAVTYKAENFYFGRTFDNDFSYNERITVTPRNYPFLFRNGKRSDSHLAIIGMAYVCNDYPLYYDAVNERGLCMAGLNFVGNAHFGEAKEGRENVAVFEFIPYILSECSNVREAKSLLSKINLTDEPFNCELPVAQIHWLIADRDESITVESVKDGMKVYDNPVGVLTNNPPFDMQMFCLNNFMHLSPKEPENLFSDRLALNTYSRGMGALGLPGDLSSQSRFVRAAFTKINSVSCETDKDNIGQFYHIMDSVQQQKGCCVLSNGKYEMTIYTSCCNADKGIYYYTTYNNRQITGVDMYKENLEGSVLCEYPLINNEQIKMQNSR